MVIQLFFLLDESLGLNDCENEETDKNDTRDPENPVVTESVENLGLSVDVVLVDEVLSVLG